MGESSVWKGFQLQFEEFVKQQQFSITFKLELGHKIKNVC